MGHDDVHSHGKDLQVQSGAYLGALKNTNHIYAAADNHWLVIDN